MGAEEQHRPFRHFRKRFGKADALFSQIVHNKIVVNDFMQHVNRRAAPVQHRFHRPERAPHTGTHAVRNGNKNFFFRVHLDIIIRDGFFFKRKNSGKNPFFFNSNVEFTIKNDSL